MNDTQAVPQGGGIPLKNYYGGWNEQSADNLKYRLDAKDAINDLCDQLRGIRKDRMGRPVQMEPGEQERLRIMNEEGIYRVQTFLQSACGKITHLTKYENEDRVLRQMRSLARSWLFVIVLNRKRWDIKDKDIILHAGEKLLFESMLRAKEGFENNNISQTYIVNENIERNGMPPTQRRQGFFGRFFGGGQG